MADLEIYNGSADDVEVPKTPIPDAKGVDRVGIGRVHSFPQVTRCLGSIVSSASGVRAENDFHRI